MHRHICAKRQQHKIDWLGAAGLIFFVFITRRVLPMLGNTEEDPPAPPAKPPVRKLEPGEPAEPLQIHGVGSAVHGSRRVEQQALEERVVQEVQEPAREPARGEARNAPRQRGQQRERKAQQR